MEAVVRGVRGRVHDRRRRGVDGGSKGGPAGRRPTSRLGGLVVPLAALLLAGCASAATPDAASGEPATAVADVQVPIDDQSMLQLPVGGVSTAPMMLGIEPGDLSTSGTLTSAASPQPGPAQVPWSTPAGSVTDVVVDARVDGPLTLAFAAGPRHTTAVPVIWRQDGKVGWHPLVAAPPGQIASVQRSTFGLHVASWADPGGWVDDRGAAMAGWAGGRPAPPGCDRARAGAPSWVTVTPAALDVLVACTRVGRGGAVEVEVANNRGMTQQIALPAGVAYAEVQDQPEYVRALVRDLTKRPDAVLLPPGKRLVIGLTQPNQDVLFTLDPQPSALALALDLTVRLGDLDSGLDVDATALAAAELPDCVSADRQGLQGDAPTDAELEPLLTRLGGCLGTSSSSYERAYALAERFQSRKSGIRLGLLRADPSYTLPTEKVAGRLNLLGALGQSADLSRLAPVVRNGLADQGRPAAGPPDAAAVRVALAGRTSA